MEDDGTISAPLMPSFDTPKTNRTRGYDLSTSQENHGYGTPQMQNNPIYYDPDMGYGGIKDVGYLSPTSSFDMSMSPVLKGQNLKVHFENHPSILRTPNSKHPIRSDLPSSPTRLNTSNGLGTPSTPSFLRNNQMIMNSGGSSKNESSSLHSSFSNDDPMLMSPHRDSMYISSPSKWLSQSPFFSGFGNFSSFSPSPYKRRSYDYIGSDSPSKSFTGMRGQDSISHNNLNLVSLSPPPQNQSSLFVPNLMNVFSTPGKSNQSWNQEHPNHTPAGHVSRRIFGDSNPSTSNSDSNVPVRPYVQPQPTPSNVAVTVSVGLGELREQRLKFSKINATINRSSQKGLGSKFPPQIQKSPSMRDLTNRAAAYLSNDLTNEKTVRQLNFNAHSEEVNSSSHGIPESQTSSHMIPKIESSLGFKENLVNFSH